MANLDQKRREIFNIEVERHGVRLRGRYTVDYGFVTVRSALGVKSTPLGGHGDPHALARQLLLELLDEPKVGF